MLFTRTTDLVQRLQVARRELALEAAITRLDNFDLLILDDLAYVTKDQAETSVLFELISARYERRSMLITANQPFGEWNRIFPDPAMTLAAVDRLVHHATIFEMNVESYRRRAALERRNAGRAGRPPARQSKPPPSDAPRHSTSENPCARQSTPQSSRCRDAPISHPDRRAHSSRSSRYRAVSFLSDEFRRLGADGRTGMPGAISS